MPSIPESKVILITGCSSGFGLLIAARLSTRGHQVIASVRNFNKKDSLLSEVNKRGGKNLEVISLDVTNNASIEEAFHTIAAKYGYLDVLINNAGFGMGGFFEDLTEEEIRQQMETNFFGVQNIIRKTIPLMRPRKKGKIINISSMAGLSASPCFSAYNASKWALEGFTESLYYELKLFGIDVHLVEPGTYKTNIFYTNARYAKNFDNPNSPYYSASQFLRKKVMDYVGQCKRNPEEVAELVEHLIQTPQASFRNTPDFWNTFALILRRILPFRIYSWLLNRGLLAGLEDSSI